MLKRLHVRPFGFVALCLMMLFSTIGSPLQSAAAAVPSLEEIRVSLFIAKRGSVPAATFQSQSTLSVGRKASDGYRPWMSLSKAFRVSGDQWMVKVESSTDANRMTQLQTAIQTAVPEAFVFSTTLNGKTTYSLYAGMYKDETAATAAAQKLGQHSSVQGKNLKVTGPKRLMGGSYSSEAEALKQQASFAAAGFVSHVAVHEEAGGSIQYTVVVGEESSSGKLTELSSQVSAAMSGVKLNAWSPPSTGYALKRTERTSGGSTVDHIQFHIENTKMWIQPTDDSIVLKERYNRTYRGNMEVSMYEGQLAVINQLPFEKYLYSVVGTEMSGSWPIEALKAQAVAARTYALGQGMKYQIAHISDTTYDQAYYGLTRETSQTIKAVDATRGEVLTDKSGKLITPFYSSNAGGMTADPTEIWGNDVPYLKSIPSPDDDPQEGLLDWYRISMPSGQIGYIRSDLLKATGRTNPAGFPIYTPNGSNINVRPAPYVPYIQNDNAPIAQVNQGDSLVVFEKTTESNVYHWIKGPYGSQELLAKLNAKLKNPISGDLRSLEVTKRGESGRVLEVEANGQLLDVSYPDQYRSLLDGLLSTRFEIEETGRFYAVGANGTSKELHGNAGLHVVGASGKTEKITNANFFAVNEAQEAGLLTKDHQYRFVGYGFGHGLGMSQYGAKELAEFMGYDYKQILKYYYQDVSIVKG
ncbi:SpoIID/LytB domain-containing protein [Marinicrinis sediminis]|uniref:SpoIID/LytB domain-containing protein n=1 Tax=Marinicrinis sediminis TaxID=1652465 RepID=A0ABW5R6T9_9BACL